MGAVYYLDDLPDEFNNTYGDYTEEPLQTEPLVKVTGIVVTIMYLLTIFIGIPANVYVLVRMKRFSRSDNERYRNGTGVALCSMAAADLCSLLLICAQNLQQFFISQKSSETFLMQATCKVMLFLTHTVTGVSIWSWLLLSCLRYLAIRHPLYHLRLWQMPYRALAFIIATSVVLNAWLLVAVQSTGYGCTQVPLMKNSLAANRLFHLVETCWSFCIPLAVIIVMDASVILKSTAFPRWRNNKMRRKSALEEIIKLTRSSSMRIKHGHHKALWKWLIIALICITLNAPENIFRLVTLFSLKNYTEDAAQFCSRMIAQALYFSQFAFNAIYLAVFVYDKSTRSKTDPMHSAAVTMNMRSRQPSTSGFDSPPIGKASCVRLLHPEQNLTICSV